MPLSKGFTKKAQRRSQVMDLKDTLTTLTTSFVENLMEAVRSASIADISDGLSTAAPVRPARRAPRYDVTKASGAPKPAKTGKSGRLARRSPEQIEAVVADIVALLKKSNGLRSEHIREALDLDKRELPLVIKHGLETKAFVVLSGQRRATTYGIRGAARVDRTPGPK